MTLEATCRAGRKVDAVLLHLVGAKAPFDRPKGLTLEGQPIFTLSDQLLGEPQL